jgi:hypothetical protein
VTTKQNPKEKKVNEGNLAEGVLGAAIVAKLGKRKPGGGIGKVVAQDVIQILKIMQKAPSKNIGSATKTQIKVDVGGTAKDKIMFYLNLGRYVMGELQKMDLNDLRKISDAASSYVNSPRMESLASAMYENNINNMLEIDVDGISANSSTKSDITVKTDKYIFDKISLKAGKANTGHSLGQVGGNSWMAILRLFHEGYNDRTKHKDVGMMLPINTPSNETQYMKLVGTKPTFATVQKAVRFAYQQAIKIFNSQPSGLLAKSIYKFLEFHSSRGDSDIKIVMLHLGKHKTLNPLLLEQSLKGVKLKAIVREDTKWPIFIVYDASQAPPTTKYSPNSIFAVRPRIDPRTEGYITHLVEEGPKFSALIQEKAA